MKSKLCALAILILIAAMSVAVTTVLAHNIGGFERVVSGDLNTRFTSPPPAARPAVVILDGGCSLLAANGSVFFTTETHQVFANDANGNSKITCHATQPAHIPTPKEAVRFDYGNTGMLCYTGWGDTQDWRAVVTPSGKAMLSCHISPNPTP